jgi:hypothetical protein
MEQWIIDLRNFDPGPPPLKDEFFSVSKGFPHTEESIRNISEAKKGTTPWNKGKKLKEVNDLSYAGKYKRGIVGKKQPKQRVFINPNGKKIVIKNLKEFCLKNNLCYSHMLKVHNGNLPQHKRWTVEKLAQGT